MNSQPGEVHDHGLNFDIPTEMFDFQLVYDMAVRDIASPSAQFVEIGSALGESTLYLVNALKDAGLENSVNVYAVDIWEKMEFVCSKESIKKVNDLSKQHGVYMAFLQIMRKHSALQHIMPLRMPSDIAAHLFEDESVDFVFVDGDHTYPYVKKDLDAWIPKLKIGGVLAGHDYNGWEVEKAVLERIPRSRLSLYAQKNTTRVLQGDTISWAAVKLDRQSWDKWSALEEVI